ncbi:flagellar hook-associated protein 2 [Pseudomonas sp. CFII64]|uniref:flagellar filament capping protein FliD n=1 Tax=Pseudomonas sp. CFII64 TaxID=911242 RepID=UPI000357A2A8|nr:flagellar filament capping protein FliD [Pseudomonas sp. CFII64]EPJ86255.1 flagellar hook-associated protein 2 [Pseudomonas sp. CFII64]
MASPISTSTGLGSGLAIKEIVASLVDSDKYAKQTQITKQTSLTTTKLSGVSTLKSALDAFQTAMTNLGKTDTPAFNGFSATSSLTANITATTTNSAVAGTYAMEVTKLATSSSVASASFDAAAASAIPSGTLTITQNTTNTAFEIPAGSTLQQVRDLINAKTSTSGVSANIISDGTGSRLVFGSTKTGAGTDITTSSTIAGLTIGSTDVLDPNSATSAGRIGDAPINGEMLIGGLKVTSSTNTYSSALTGVTITAVAVGKSTVTVAGNTDGLKTSLQTFVDAYNNVVKTINSLTKATADANGDLTVSAAMTGDSLPRDLLATLREQLITPGPGSKLSTLAQLGIQTAQSGGTLTFDAGKFTKAMNDKNLGSEVQQMFSGTNAENGLLARMKKAIEPYNKTGGTLDERTKSLNKTSTDLKAQQTALDIRVANLTSTLTAKYNAMDLLVGQMKSTLSSITSFFDTLNAQASG